MAEQVFSGVPRALALDAWWMSADAEFDAPRHIDEIRQMWWQRTRKRFAVLVTLLLLADVLFFGQAIGVSIAIYCIAVFAASVLEHGNLRGSVGPSILLILSVLPVVEHTQFVSVVFAILGLLVCVAWHRVGMDTSATAVVYAVRRMVVFLPIGTVQGILDWFKTPATGVNFSSMFKDFLRHWAFPLGGGLLILSLLISANPVLERMIDGLMDVEIDFGRFVRRAFFWIGIGSLLWPILVVSNERLRRPFDPVPMVKVHGYGLNATSVSNALWAFNGLMLIQLVMDGAFVVGGELPYGMSYAEYAHRGAYPLVVTALLAGCFALAARSFLNEGRWLKPLMILWLVLNGMLTIASMYRLELYVEVYGLTYLRVRAGIWMVLVAVWLGLIGWQIVKAKANGWLAVRSFAMGIGVLYVGCFVNFAEMIAAYNKAHPRYASVTNYSFCPLIGLSKTANRAVQEREGCAYYYTGPHIEGWRDWGFRAWRVARYMQSIEVDGERHENSGR